jgi:hypothetical protein
MPEDVVNEPPDEPRRDIRSETEVIDEKDLGGRAGDVQNAALVTPALHRARGGTLDEALVVFELNQGEVPPTERNGPEEIGLAAKEASAGNDSKIRKASDAGGRGHPEVGSHLGGDALEGGDPVPDAVAARRQLGGDDERAFAGGGLIEHASPDLAYFGAGGVEDGASTRPGRFRSSLTMVKRISALRSSLRFRLPRMVVRSS